MSETGLEAFDSTLQKTNVWLREIMDDLGIHDRHLAYAALRATLHALRDRLIVNEAVQLGAQLPMLVRGIYYEGWHPGGKGHKAGRSEFLDSIRNHFRSSVWSVDPTELAEAVFRVLERHVTAGEIEDVKRSLPADLRELWP
jgi:uncharacterized protein (DUF2267 family)